MPDKYAEALEDLERMRAEGKVTQSQYDVHRARLLAEAAKPKRSRSTQIVLFVVAVAALFVLWRVVLALVA